MRKGKVAKRGAAAVGVGGATGGAALFVVVLIALFVLAVGVVFIQVGVEFTLESDELFEKVLALPITGVLALIAAGVVAGLLGTLVGALQRDWVAVLTGGPAPGGRGEAIAHVLVGLTTALFGILIGGWRLRAGVAQADEGWATQGILILALAVMVGALLLMPNLWLAVRPGRATRRSQPAKVSSDSDDAASSPITFAFLACLGLLVSFGVSHWVQLRRAQAGVVPLAVGAYARGKLTTEGFEGYPEQAELLLPANLKGEHTISWVLDSCDKELVDDSGKAVEARRVKVEQERFAMVFAADPSRRYRLRLTRGDDSFCLYSIKLRRGLPIVEEKP